LQRQVLVEARSRTNLFSVAARISSTAPNFMWLSTSARICSVSSLEKRNRSANGLGHANADLHVMVETNAVAGLRRGLERWWLADIVEQNAPS